MKELINKLLMDLDWRERELLRIKSMPVKYKISDKEYKTLYYKMSVTAIYAVWEGFVKETFKEYSRQINSYKLDKTKISLPLLTHHVDCIAHFDGGISKDFSKKQDLVKKINKSLNDVISLPPNVPTNSNVNLKVLCSIFDRFCVTKKSIKTKEFEDGLNKLLKYRNNIAHGEYVRGVDINIINELSSLILNLMGKVILCIQTSLEKKTYINKWKSD